MHQTVGRLLLPLRLGLSSILALVGFMVDNTALRKIFLQVLRLTLSVSFHNFSILFRSSVTDRV
jgi:hypothetical protein